MQVFGIGAELLQGGKGGVPYAAGALNRELLTNLLETYQEYQRQFLYERMEVVAERQGHYEYEVRGGVRYPEMETALMYDEESGEEYVIERPKLAIPEVTFRSMQMHDEQVERGFLSELRQLGWPISNETMAVGISARDLNWKDELEKSQ